MKKNLAILGVAVLALASCAKTQVISNETPTPIAFKAVANNAVKADAQLAENTLKADWGIYAYATYSHLDGATVVPNYLSDQLFVTADATPTQNSVYSADPVVYWPLGGATLDFVTYAVPTADHATVAATPIDADDVSKGLTFSWDTYANQIDLLYAVRNGATAAASDLAGAEKIKLSFNHAQALLIFQAKINTADVLTINSITINGLKFTGTFTVDNSRNNLVAAWSNLGPTPDQASVVAPGATVGADYIGEALDAAAVADFVQVGSTLLIPEQPRKNFVINYTIGTGLGARTMEYEWNEARGNWEKGHSYTYQITFTATAIEFTQEVATYVNENVAIPLN